MNPTTLLQIVRKIPTKWALALIGLLIAYALVQPVANRQFAWHLPSLAAGLGQTEKAPSRANPDPQSSAESAGARAATDSNSAASAELGTDQPQLEPSGEAPGNRQASSVAPAAQPRGPRTAESRTPSFDQPSAVEKRSATAKNEPAAKNPASNANSEKNNRVEFPRMPTSSAKQSPIAGEKLLYGVLKEVGREKYISLKGLRYGPGSEEGHRLKHLERHLTDMPTRPGKHGVFDGDMGQALRWIDDAYDRGQKGAKGVRKIQEDSRTVFEVPFDKPIGYIGGRDGGRSRNPSSKRLRLVVDGNQFITAFPF